MSSCWKNFFYNNKGTLKNNFKPVFEDTSYAEFLGKSRIMFCTSNTETFKIVEGTLCRTGKAAPKNYNSWTKESFQILSLTHDTRIPIWWNRGEKCTYWGVQRKDCKSEAPNRKFLALWISANVFHVITFCSKMCDKHVNKCQEPEKHLIQFIWFL